MIAERDILPNDPPPRTARFWGLLLAEPCPGCGHPSALRLQHATLHGAPETRVPATPGLPPYFAAASMTVELAALCGNCGEVVERDGWVPTHEHLTSQEWQPPHD
jgi:hypothetical protein